MYICGNITKKYTMVRHTLLRPVRERTKEDWGEIIRRYDALRCEERAINSRRADHLGVGYYYEILAEEFRLSKNYIIKIISSRHNQ